MANLRVRQAADYVGLSKSFLDKARCNRTGPAYAKLGASIIYSTEDLDAWVESRMVVPTNDNIETRAAA